MNSEYLYPGLLDRDSRDDWERKGARDIREAARERARKVLAEHWPEVIPGDLDAEIRRRFEILLPPQAMPPAARGGADPLAPPSTRPRRAPPGGGQSPCT